MVATFHFHCLVHRDKYGNPEVGNTTQIFLSITWPCCSIEFIESFLFWVILVTYNIGIYICIYIYEVSYIYSLYSFFLISSTVKVFYIACQTIWDMKKHFVKLMSGLLHSLIHQGMWHSGCSQWIHFPFYAVFFFFPVFPLVYLSLAYCWVSQLR